MDGESEGRGDVVARRNVPEKTMDGVWRHKNNEVGVRNQSLPHPHWGGALCYLPSPRFLSLSSPPSHPSLDPLPPPR